MSNVLIRRMVSLYGEIDHPNPEGFLSELADATKTRNAEDLDQAVNILRREWRGRSWPSFGRIMDACERAAEDRASKIPQQPDRGYPDYSQLHPLVRGPIAHQAVKGGWINGLNEYCHNHGKLPGSRQQARMIETANIVNDVADNGAGGIPQLEPVLKEFAMSFQVRRIRLAEQLAERERSASAE